MTGYAPDYPYFKPLVDRTAEIGFKMKQVSADKAYLGADNMLTTLRQGAIPYIPFKTNSAALTTVQLQANGPSGL